MLLINSTAVELLLLLAKTTSGVVSNSVSNLNIESGFWLIYRATDFCRVHLRSINLIYTYY